LASGIPDIDRYLLPIVVLIIIVSLLPAIIGTVRAQPGFRIRERLGMRPRGGRAATSHAAGPGARDFPDKPPEA